MRVLNRRMPRACNSLPVTQTGFTLFELMVTLCVMCLIAVLVYPTFTYYLQASESRLYFSQIRPAFADARMRALSLHEGVSICPSMDGSHCSRDWTGGLMLFSDRAATGSPATPTAILGFYPLQLNYGHLRWQAFRSRNFIHFQGDMGMAIDSNGTLAYCNSIHNELNRAAILSRTAQIRPALDMNHDGIADMPDGSAIRC